jgi:hypothetical protein
MNCRKGHANISGCLRISCGAEALLIQGLMRRATKTEFSGIGGPANYIRIVPIRAAPSGARKRTVHRTCKRSLPLPPLQAQ